MSGEDDRMVGAHDDNAPGRLLTAAATLVDAARAQARVADERAERLTGELDEFRCDLERAVTDRDRARAELESVVSERDAARTRLAAAGSRAEQLVRELTGVDGDRDEHPAQPQQARAPLGGTPSRAPTPSSRGGGIVKLRTAGRAGSGGDTGPGAIRVRGLTKRFGRVVAVDDLSFDVTGGAVTGFLGPNGAGKSTTLRMLLGLVEPTAGTATICGRPYRDLPDRARVVGAALDASGFQPGRTARNHLRVRATASRIDARRVDAALDMVGLADAAGRRVGGFSLGMRQRLGLAAALLGDPEVLILDEPANGLDPDGVRWLRNFLRGLAADGRTVLVSSHILAEVVQTVDDVIVLDHGRLLAQESLDALMPGTREPADLEEAFFALTSPNAEEVAR